MKSLSPLYSMLLLATVTYTADQPSHLLQFDELPPVSWSISGQNITYKPIMAPIVPPLFARQAQDLADKSGTQLLIFFPQLLMYYSIRRPTELYVAGFEELIRKFFAGTLTTLKDAKEFCEMPYRMCWNFGTSPQTAENVTQACLQIASGNAIDLKDPRLQYNEEQELYNNGLIVAQLPMPLKDVIFNDTRRYRYYMERLLPQVFQALHKKQPLHISDIDYDASGSIIKNHNDSITPDQPLWYVSPQTTLRIAQELEQQLTTGQSSSPHTHAYNKQEERANFMAIFAQFPPELQATTDRCITDAHYRQLAFSAYALQNPRYKHALVGSCFTYGPVSSSHTVYISEAIKEILKTTKTPYALLIHHDLCNTFIKTFEKKDIA